MQKDIRFKRPLVTVIASLLTVSFFTLVLMLAFKAPVIRDTVLVVLLFIFIFALISVAVYSLKAALKYGRPENHRSILKAVIFLTVFLSSAAIFLGFINEAIESHVNNTFEPSEVHIPTTLIYQKTGSTIETLTPFTLNKTDLAHKNLSKLVFDDSEKWLPGSIFEESIGEFRSEDSQLYIICYQSFIEIDYRKNIDEIESRTKVFHKKIPAGSCPSPL